MLAVYMEIKYIRESKREREIERGGGGAAR